MSHPIYHHYITNDNDVYMSPNSPTIPVVPAIAPLPDTPSKREFQIPRWAETRHPFLAYVPMQPRYDSPPFDRLKDHGTKYKAIRHGSGWRVDPYVVKQFETLETNLLFIIQVMRHRANILMFLNFAPPSNPRDYGYNREHKTVHGAQKSAELARDAFLPLMALCAYSMSYMDGIVPGSDDVWHWELALQEAGANIDSVKEYKESELVNFSKDYPRAGVFIRNDFWQFKNLVPRFERNNVPVWVWWGNNINPSSFISQTLSEA